MTLSFSEPSLRTRVENNQRRIIKSAKTPLFRKTFTDQQKIFTNGSESLKQKSLSAPAINFQVNSKSRESGAISLAENDRFREIFIPVDPIGDGEVSQSSNESEINEVVEVSEDEKCYGNNKNNLDLNTFAPLCPEKKRHKKLNHEKTVKRNFFSHLLCS